MRGMSEAFHSPVLFRAHQITHAGKKQGEWKQCGKSFFQVVSSIKEVMLESIPPNESNGESITH